MGLNEQAITTASEKHPRADVKYTYGTAGFRTIATVLESVLFRVGLLAALRSKKMNGQVIGVMVTASHNPEQDNGVKLVDPRGEMLHASWESYATLLANSTTSSALLSSLAQIIKESSIDLSTPAKVVYGYDTRPSCPALVKALENGLRVIEGTDAIKAGLVTTPQLHYLVRCLNTAGTKEAYGEPTVEGYYTKLANAYKTLASGKAPLSPLTVDCANGVGAPKLQEFTSYLPSSVFPVNITKSDVSTIGALNNSCGADYVKTKQMAPPGVDLVEGNRYCSFDGDADRIVYYYKDHSGAFRLLDGDKIAGLAAGFIMDLVKEAGLKINVGVVQTAYANGASTKYLTDVLGVPVTCVSTGVKHLHHAAESYDVGVYFEANGHGTVLFSPSALATIFAPSNSSSQALKNLQALTELINQTVGDAISDMLLVEIVLLHRQWTPADWDEGYEDLPNRLIRVFVKDRSVFKVTDAERQLVEPRGLQDMVNEEVKKVESGRSFVRPSGTEDCVRVYAEAKTRELTDKLIQTVGGLVFDAAGEGEKPAKFT